MVVACIQKKKICALPCLGWLASHCLTCPVLSCLALPWLARLALPCLPCLALPWIARLALPCLPCLAVHSLAVRSCAITGPVAGSRVAVEIATAMCCGIAPVMKTDGDMTPFNRLPIVNDSIPRPPHVRCDRPTNARVRMNARAVAFPQSTTGSHCPRKRRSTPQISSKARSWISLCSSYVEALGAAKPKKLINVMVLGRCSAQTLQI